MLDYDFLCGRSPSVKAIVSDSKQSRQYKVFYGDRELLIPRLTSRDQCELYGDVDTLINLASFRSAGAVTKQALQSGYFRNIVVIAEGIPERETREIIVLRNYIQQKEGRDVTLLGPSTVGGMIAGALRIGHSGGSLDNIIKSKLYRPGSIGFVSKSGGMMNEMCRVMSKETDGIHTSLALGGDRYPMLTFIDTVRSYQAHDDIKMIVLLGEVGNEDENQVADAMRSGEITKPVVARVTGTVAGSLQSEVQFGHAGAKANSERETAAFKNNYLQQAGAHVPTSFDEFGSLIGKVYREYIDEN